MLRLRGDAAEADVGTKFIYESRLIARKVFLNRIHLRKYSESPEKAKLDCVRFISAVGQKPSYL